MIGLKAEIESRSPSNVCCEGQGGGAGGVEPICVLLEGVIPWLVFLGRSVYYSILIIIISQPFLKTNIHVVAF